MGCHFQEVFFFSLKKLEFIYSLSEGCRIEQWIRNEREIRCLTEQDPEQPGGGWVRDLEKKEALVYIIGRNNSRWMGIYLQVKTVEGFSWLASSSYYLPSLAFCAFKSNYSSHLCLIFTLYRDIHTWSSNNKNFNIVAIEKENRSYPLTYFRS